MSTMTLTLSPSTCVLVIPVAIDEYDVPPENNPSGRTQLETLTRIRTDVALLRSLFESAEYRAAGFQMLEPITGSAGEIVTRLTAISTMLWEQDRPLNALLFWSGHGRAWGNQMRLATKDCFEPMRPVEGLPPSEVVNKLAGSKVRTLGFLCDVCQGGAAGAGVIEAAAQHIDLAGGTFKGFASLFSAYAYENAKDGLFVETLAELLRNGPSAAAIQELAKQGRGGLTVNRLFAVQDVALLLEIEMDVLRATNASVPSPLPFHFGSALPLFPNPVWKKDLRPANVGETRRRRLLQGDVEAHFLPKARGLEPEEAGWFFSGRRDVTRKIVAWLEGAGTAGKHNLFVLTGGGGTGKSAIVGRFVTLSDPEYRAEARAQGWQEAQDTAEQTVPPVDAIDAALHLRKLTAQQVTRALNELLQLDLRDDDAQLASFVNNAPVRTKAGDRNFRVVLDALDESEEPAQIAAELIRPLASKGWHIFVASRRSSAARGADDLLELLGPAHVHDLSDEPTTEAEIAEYVTRRLLDTQGSAYAASPEVSAPVAAFISKRAAGKFLYARLAVTGLLRRAERIEPDRLENYLGATIGDILARAFRELDVEFMTEFNRTDAGATALLAALVWGEGDGLPIRDDLWSKVATAIGAVDPPLTQDHVLWLLRSGGRFIVESSDGDQAVYRLYHESLNEYFRAQPRLENAHVPVASALEDALEQPDGWEVANPYLVRHLATHLARLPDNERLRRLLLDYAWMHSKLHRLGIRALLEDYARSRSRDAAVASLERALSTSAHVLAWDPDELPSQLLGRLLGTSVPELVAVLEAARASRYTWLRPLIASLAGERSLRWLRPKNGSTLDQVAFSADCHWAAHVQAFSEVVLWDLERWNARGALFKLPDGFCYALALSRDARSCLVSHSDGRISHWIAGVGIKELRAHEHLVDLLAISADGTHALSADQDGRLVAWDFARQRADVLWDGLARTTAISFDATGRKAVVARADGVVSLVQLSPSRHKDLFTLQGRPTALAWTSDSATVFVATADGRGHVEARSVNNAARPFSVLRGEGEPASLGLSADDRHLAVGTATGAVEVWDIARGKFVARYPRAHTHAVSRIGFAAESGHVISADTLHLKEWALELYDEQDKDAVRHQGMGVVMVEENLHAAGVIGDGQLGLWNARTGVLDSMLPPAQRRSLKPSIQRKGIALSSGVPRVLAWDAGLLCLWDLRAEVEAGSLRATDVRDAAIGPNGRSVVFIDGKQVLHWQPGSETPDLLGNHGETASRIAVSPDGKLALSSGGDRAVMLWALDVRARKTGGTALDRLWPDARDKPTLVAFSNNTQAVVATGDSSLFVLNTRERPQGLRLLGKHESYVRDLLTTFDGRAVTGSHDRIRVWDLNTLELTAEFKAHAGNLARLSARGDRLLLSTPDGVLKIVSLQYGSLIAAFQADKQLVACAADANLEWIAALDEEGRMHFLHCENA